MTPAERAAWLRERHLRRRQRVEVPELGDDGSPAVVYVAPYTCGDHAAVGVGIQAGDFRAHAELVSRAVTDADGSAFFEDVDIVLETVEPEIVWRLSAVVLESIVSVEDALGN